MTTSRAADAGSALVTALERRLPWPVERIETHISWVLLAGEHAIKIKKPVKLPFADFSTLEARRRGCEEELRLNRRTAPALYECVVPISGAPDAPVLGGYGPPLEWAVLMRRFDPAMLFDRLAAAGSLTPALVDDLTHEVARLHRDAERSPPGSPFGTHAEVRVEAEGNFATLLEDELGWSEDPRLRALHTWSLRAEDRLRGHFARRQAGGFVRECHGDLHLGNVALIDGRAVPFDALEFDERLRRIDVMSEVAFTAMDLANHGLAGLGHRFVDAYLAHTGDYGGVALLRFYFAYRALVRAKIAALRARQAGGDPSLRADRMRSVSRHLDLATTVLAPPAPALLAMVGLPGSGKTWLSQKLLEATGAIRIRSDVERKRLFGLDGLARSGSAPGAGLYSPEADARTLERLAGAAAEVIEAGHVAIVDATNHRRATRARLQAIARSHDVPFVLVACEAPDDVLRERLARRGRGTDASEADLAVLERQQARFEPLSGEELEHAVIVDETAGHFVAEDAVRAVARQIA